MAFTSSKLLTKLFNLRLVDVAVRCFQLSIVVVSLTSTNCISQVKDLDKFELSGKVKSVHTRYFLAKDTLGKVHKVEMMSIWFHENQAVEFNRMGKVNRYVMFDTTGRISSEDIYEYDTLLNTVTVLSLSYENDTIDTVKTRDTFKYGKDGIIDSSWTEQCYFNDKWALAYQKYYDSRGNCIKMNVVQMDMVFEMKYDDQGNLIEKEQYWNIEGERENIERDTYTYDENGSMTRFSYSEIGELDLIVTDTCNEYGDRIKTIENWPEKRKENTITFTYKYDDHNNWTERTRFMNGKADQVTERLIEYYE